MTKVWDKSSIVELLIKSDKAVGQALVRLTERQTYDERTDKSTKYQNGRGFRPCHARLGTYNAEMFKRYGKLYDSQIKYWREKDKTGTMRIAVYANQLLSLVEKKA